jgi:hypothetical protein
MQAHEKSSIRDRLLSRHPAEALQNLAHIVDGEGLDAVSGAFHGGRGEERVVHGLLGGFDYGRKERIEASVAVLGDV